jgi:hypothetical protein
MRIRLLGCLICAVSLIAVSQHLHAEGAADLDPLVAQLISLQHVDAMQVDSDFLTTLSTISKNQSWKAFNYGSNAAFQSGKAFRYVQSGTMYVVVILEPAPVVIPGPWMQDLLLLDGRGRLLDRVQCTINSRLFTDGVFRTDFTNEAERDGARLIVRFTPTDEGEELSNFSHEILLGGNSRKFSWKDGFHQWKQYGLCRVTVKESMFHVLRPAMPPDKPMSRE